MLGGGFLNPYHNYGGFLRYNSDFFPFCRFFDLSNYLSTYDYTEFLVYTIVPILVYYSYWLWFKKQS